MTEEALNQGESVEEPAGTDAQPEQTVSAATEQPSLDAAALVAALQENPDFLQFVESKVQSVKDKRFQKLEDKTDDFESKLAELRGLQDKFNFTEEQAMEFMKRTQQPVVQPEQAGNQQVEAKDFDRDSFARGLGLDPNDSKIAKMGQLEMAQYAVNRAANPRPAPSTAQNMPSSSGTPLVNRDLAEVQAEYDEAFKKYTANPTAANREKRERLGAELKQLIPREN